MSVRWSGARGDHHTATRTLNASSARAMTYAMPDPIDAMLAQYLADVGDVPASSREDESLRLTREALKDPSLTTVLQAALRDGPELDDDLRRLGPELPRLFHAGGLDDVLAWACFAAPDEGVALACAAIRGVLDSGELNMKTEAARQRAGQLRAALEAVETRESLIARRCQCIALAAQRSTAKSYRDKQVVEAAKALLGMADEDHTLFSRVGDAAVLARHLVDVAPQWAERFTPLARERTRLPSFEPIEDWRATHAFRGAFRSEMHVLVTQMSAGPINLRRHLFERPVSRQELEEAWRREDHLDVLLPLAANEPRFDEAVRALVPDAAPQVLVDAVAAVQREVRHVDRIVRAREVGYLLGPSAELAARLRDRMGELDLYAVLTALTAKRR